MKIGTRDPAQTAQRVRVGVFGLAAILLLIGMATTIFGVVSREKPATAIGAPRADVAANLSNSVAPSDAPTGEPLAQIGIAPATSPTPAAH
ncbi:MAG: hypothetical protein J0I47_08890 [Sphingomonas sp.]|uniref:hypothetical protein n=1 Tax=Sphingomonas sp. TaxID=28214 RepID=UPI001AC82E91|nr:hypothetical protein [Sphingomonas sp.]MBN8808334.1 hypothetical protein [Sphingomonas sp.]